MKQRNYFLVVREMSEEGVELKWGYDIFMRPMPWGIWFKSIIPFRNNPYRFVRVFGLLKPFSEYCPYWEDGDVFFDAKHVFTPEKVTPLFVIEWAIQSIYYGTSLRFWRWPVCVEIKQKVKRFFSSW